MTDLENEIIKIVHGARVITRVALFSVFADRPKITIHKAVQRLLGDPQNPEKLPRYLETIKRHGDPRLRAYFNLIGRSQLLATGAAGSRLLGVPVKNNEWLSSDEHLLHFLMNSQFCATLFKAQHEGMITMTDYKREVRGPSVFIPEAKKDQTYALTPDAEFKVNNQLYFLENETGTVKRYRTDFEQSSFWKKICWYNALDKYLVAEQKMPGFEVIVVCLTVDHVNQLREYVYNANPRQNLFRFTLFEYIRPDDPAVLLQEKIFHDAISDPPVAKTFFD